MFAKVDVSGTTTYHPGGNDKIESFNQMPGTSGDTRSASTGDLLVEVCMYG